MRKKIVALQLQTGKWYAAILGTYDDFSLVVITTPSLMLTEIRMLRFLEKGCCSTLPQVYSLGEWKKEARRINTGVRDVIHH